MYLKFHIIAFALFCMTLDSIAQSKPQHVAYLDSLNNLQIDEKSEDFYRRTNLGGKKFKNFLFRSLFVESDSTPFRQPRKEIIINEDYWKPFNGKTIENITITPLNVFPGADSLMTGFQRLANKTHTATRQQTIRRYLLFDVGSKFDAHRVAATQAYLRDLDLFSNATIIVTESAYNPNSVDINIITNDKWSLGFNIATPRINRLHAEIYDDNLLGYGMSLKLRTCFHTKGAIYAGNQIDIEIPNLSGTFADLNFAAGRSYDRYILGLGINKNFVTANDWGGGISGKSERWDYDFLTCDSTHTISNSTLTAWAGKSVKLSNNIAFYMAMSGEYTKFHLRPNVSEDYNSLFHNRKIGLISVGIYNEKFYTGRYIYGYGRTEDVPYGYHLSLTGGYSSCEFDNRFYIGSAATMSRPTPIGHLQLSAEFGTRFNSHQLSQTNMNFGLNWFSTLFSIGKTSVARQFLSCWLTMGFNRSGGEGEHIGFTYDYSPRDLSRKDLFGTKRLLIKTETVLFSSLHTYGFQFAFFSFADAAWLGNGAIFNNDFFSSVGIGVRIKNERLIFRTIQLRIAIPFYKNGIYRGDYVHLSQEPKLRLPHLRPTAPQILPFK